MKYCIFNVTFAWTDISGLTPIAHKSHPVSDVPDKNGQMFLWNKEAFTALTAPGLIYTSATFDPKAGISKFIKKSFKCIQNTFSEKLLLFLASKSEHLKLKKNVSNIHTKKKKKDYLKKKSHYEIT